MPVLLSSVFFLAVAASSGGCSKTAEPDQTFTPTSAKPLPAPPTTLQIKDDLVGTGREAKTGDTVHIHYTGTLLNGEKFDSSRDRGEPFKFTIGKGEVIKGWDQGVPGMKVGGKRTLVIPPDLGYGAAGSPPKIPGGAGLKFELELMSID